MKTAGFLFSRHHKGGLVGTRRGISGHDGDVDDDQDQAPQADAQAHVVQGPGCSAVPLCCLQVPGLVGIAGLRGRREKRCLIRNNQRKQPLNHLCCCLQKLPGKMTGGGGITHRCSV